MIKFVLAFIALILVILGIYTYTNQDAKKTVPTSSSVTKDTQKIEVEEKVLPQAHEVKAKKSSVKNIAVKSPKVVSSETSNEMADEEDITQEDIDSAGSEEEEKRMISLAAYKETSKTQRAEALSEEDFLKVLKNHFNDKTK